MKTKSNNPKKSKIQLFIYIGGLAAIVIATICVCMNREVKSSQYEYKDHNYDVSIEEIVDGDGEKKTHQYIELTDDQIYSSLDKVDWDNIDAGTEIYYYDKLANGNRVKKVATKNHRFSQDEIEEIKQNMLKQDRMTALISAWIITDESRELLFEYGFAYDKDTKLICDKDGNNVTNEFEDISDNIVFIKSCMEKASLSYDWEQPIYNYARSSNLYDNMYEVPAHEDYVKNLAEEYDIHNSHYSYIVNFSNKQIYAYHLRIDGTDKDGKNKSITVSIGFLGHGI